MKKIVLPVLWLLFAWLPSFGQGHVPGQVLVKFRYNLSPLEVINKDVLAANDLVIDRCVSPPWNIWLLTTTPGNEEKAMSFIDHQQVVQLVQLNHYLQKRNTTPNDPLFGSQWNMLNTGQSGGAAGKDINAAKAWDITTGGYTALGDTIVVAVIDGGMDLNQPDISYWKNKYEIPNNGIDDDRDGYIDDYNGWNATEHNDSIGMDSHGTHVCGIVGAKGNDSLGVCGVSWTTKIMPLYLYNYTEDEVVEDYTFVYTQRLIYNQTGGARGAFVVATNSSFGIDNGHPADYPLWCGMYDSLGRVGILSAAATANNAINVDDAGDIPTTCPSDYLISVTNMARNGAHNPASAIGPVSIDLEAPGTSITSTLPFNTYGAMSGTSMASPHIAGAVALLYAAGCSRFMQACYAHPDSIALMVKGYILAGTDTAPDLVGKTVTGGRLDVYNSMLRLLNDFCDSCLNLNVTTQPVTCNGANDGDATLTVIDGVPPYGVIWSNGDRSQRATGLGAGNYNVQVSDSAGCNKLYYFNISQPDILATGYTVTRDTDHLSNGAIATQVQGGTPPYTFAWSNGATSQSLNNIADGTYVATVTDSNQCSRTDSVTVTSVTGIKDVALNDQVKVYPNPTTDNVQLELPDEFNNSTLELTDLLGQTLWKQPSNNSRSTLPLSFLQKGVYILRVSNADHEVVRKIVRL